MAEPFVYDVAFSFLECDQPLAFQLNDQLQGRVKTFIYTEQQKIVAGTDGEVTFNRVFSTEARLVVVLHRTGWGAKGWTQVEQTAIRNRAFQKGWNFAKFIPLEEPLQVPERVPSAQVWIGLKHSGIVGAAAVIEARIQDAGGQVHEETLEEHAQRVQRGIEFSERREKFQWDEGVRAARQEVEALRAALLSRAEAVKRATPIQLSLRQLRFGGACLIGLGRALSIAWKQEASNHLRGAILDVTLLSHRPAGPGEIQIEEPERIRSLRFTFDLLPSEAGGWISVDAERRIFSTEALAEHITNFYLKHGRRE